MTKTLRDMGQKELERLIGVLTAELTDINQTRKRKAASLAEVQAELTRRKDGTKFQPSLSDHALLRYIERFCGFDVEALRARLMTDGLVTALRAGAAKYTENQVTYLLRDNTVVTIVDREAA